MHDPLTLADVTGVVLPILQTIVALVLGVISKLLRDIRNELLSMDRRLARTEVIQAELEKRIVEQVHTIQREQDMITRRLERMTGVGT